ncbi:ATP synthase subunit I [Alteromonas sediminis]|uniref:ATP synthase subunit I n=1 Tax=Alteromonas sediminis TaxID=2259342 RepID=UPI001404DC1B|nr:ATP synthase subunit I [Alteromonas sediminis]
MTGTLKSIAAGKKIAKKGLVLQLAFSAVLVSLATLLFGALAGASVALGAFTSILPNAVFSFFAFRFSGARQSRMVEHSFSQGLRIKLALTCGLFAVAFIGLSLSPLPVIAGFVAAVAIHWMVMFWLSSTSKG